MKKEIFENKDKTLDQDQYCRISCLFMNKVNKINESRKGVDQEAKPMCSNGAEMVCGRVS